jgi:hypothetical protein
VRIRSVGVADGQRVDRARAAAAAVEPLPAGREVKDLAVGQIARGEIVERVRRELPQALVMLDRPAGELPTLKQETAALALALAREMLLADGIELTDLVLEGLTVADSQPGERRMTPVPQPPAPLPLQGLSDLMHLPFPDDGAIPMDTVVSETAGSQGVSTLGLGELLRTGRVVPHAGLDGPVDAGLHRYLEWVAQRATSIPWETIDSYAAEFFHPEALAPEALHIQLYTDQDRALTKENSASSRRAVPPGRRRRFLCRCHLCRRWRQSAATTDCCCWETTVQASRSAQVRWWRAWRSPRQARSASLT